MSASKWIARLGALLLGALIAPGAGAGQAVDEVTGARATVAQFHQALREGDRAAAMALLAPDAQVLEAGTIENRAQYEDAHLAADIEFSQAIRLKYTTPAVSIDKNIAWTTASAKARGEFRGRRIDTEIAELMVLTRNAAGWRIRAIHWSSRPR